jgi:prepilin-type N-terminal cleavage/methylation domain-containing protein
MSTRGEKMTRVSKGEGFTLVELMIVIAIVGILSALAIPAYTSYVKKTRMSEVVAAFDAICAGASEYHAVMGFFPDASYGTDNLATFSDTYADISLVNGADSDTISISADFKANLDLRENGGSFGTLVMQINYTREEGYIKRWDIANSTIDPIFMPTGGR